MRKALVPMIASLALCGAATGALIATNARAAQTKKPVMVAMVTPPMTANGLPPGAMMDAPPGDMGGAPMPPPDGKMREHFREHMAQMCKDLYARKVGEMAFLETRLSLSQAQKSAFAHYRQINLDMAQRQTGECNTRTAKIEQRIDAKIDAKRDDKKADDRPSPIDRMAREEEMLKSRLADIQAERPALEELYNTLSPEQRKELDHPGPGGMGPMGGPRHMMMGMMHRPGMGQMGGPPGMGPMGPHGPADAPPPPPPQ